DHAVVFLLILDIPNQRIHMRWADRKRTVAGLPVKTLQLRLVLLNPLRTIPLDFSNQRRQVNRTTKTSQDMHMVGHTANDDSRTFLLSADPGQIGVSRFPKGAVPEEGLAFLRGKDDVDVNLRERLRHGPAFPGSGAIAEPNRLSPRSTR